MHELNRSVVLSSTTAQLMRAQQWIFTTSLRTTSLEDASGLAEPQTKSYHLLACLSCLSSWGSAPSSRQLRALKSSRRVWSRNCSACSAASEPGWLYSASLLLSPYLDDVVVEYEYTSGRGKFYEYFGWSKRE